MSSWADLLAWRRERFPLPAWLGLALLVASAAAPASSPRSVLRALALALGLLFQLRLMDDLADRERDAREHPERALVRATGLRPFRLALLAGGACNAALAAGGEHPLEALVALGLLTALLLGWYGGLRDRVAAPLAAAHVLLARYGGMVLVVSDRPLHPGPRVAVGAALVWLAFCAYELLHDERLRARPWARVHLALDAALLATTGALAAASVPTTAARAAVAVLLGACGVALALAVARVWRGRGPGTLRYAPLVLGLSLALSLAALQ